MKLDTPYYYKKFKCIGAACRDNCCRGEWLVEIDDETAEKYREMPGSLGDRLRTALFSEGGAAYLKRPDGTCPLLDSDGLCTVVKEAGPEALGVVCDQFPRFSEYFGDRKETGIGLACEEAARIVLSAAPEEARLTETKLDEKPYDDDEYDAGWDGRVCRARSVFDAMLEKAERGGGFDGLYKTLAAILLAAAGLQMSANKNDFEAFDAKIKSLEASAGESELLELEKRLRPLSTNAAATRNAAYIELFSHLESIGPEWDEELARLRRFYGTEPRVSRFPQTVKAFEQENSGGAGTFARYARYLLFRYLSKAVYDHDILGKCKMMALFTLTLEGIVMADAGRAAEKPAGLAKLTAAAVHLFSRQVEYDEENMEQIAEDLTFERCARTDELISALTHYTMQIG
ncbi:MAG: flagellin lysine-N-methylase [Lachnospiraceae bacterium]|jgi:lysine-N-methylase